jgi:hypothetical protein
MRLFCVCVVLCLGRGLATGCSLVQGRSPAVCKMIMKLKIRGQGPGRLDSQWQKKMKRRINGLISGTPSEFSPGSIGKVLETFLIFIWGLYNRPEVAAVPSGLSPTPPIIIKKIAVPWLVLELGSYRIHLSALDYRFSHTTWQTNTENIMLQRIRMCVSFHTNVKPGPLEPICNVVSFQGGCFSPMVPKLFPVTTSLIP